MYLEELTSEDLKEIVKFWNIVIVPVGSLEVHGPHLPLSTDTIIVEAIAKRVIEKLKDSDIKVLIGPRIRFGCSGEHIRFPGTISLNCETMIQLIYELCLSLAKNGFKNIILLNGHGGNEAPLKAAAVKLRDEAKVIVAIINWFELTSSGFTDHAGQIETSIILSLNIKPGITLKGLTERKASSKYVSLKSPVQIPLPDMWNHTSGHGYIGDPSKSNIELGEKLIEEASTNLAKYILEVKSRGYLFGKIF
ncbi:MAG: creatininase family protein [Candidatus Methanomethylicia archaeon]